MQTKLFVKGCGNWNSKIYGLKEVQKLGLSNSIQTTKGKINWHLLYGDLKEQENVICLHLPFVMSKE